MNKNNNRDNFHLFIDKYIDWYIYNHIYIWCTNNYTFIVRLYTLIFNACVHNCTC